ncbi:MAG: dihydroorotase [Chitinophagales bacterium]|nr:dihydroorotase [Chitinophagales bacterium]MDW8428152.1 dihydroorotase [Chitinophagales bacterium]
MKTLIKNATLVNEGSEQVADLLIENAHIERIAPVISNVHAHREIDAEGLYLLPGIIDDQVHFRQPGLTHKATIYSEAKAAVAGGVTSFMEMPNTLPPATTLQRLEEKFLIAQTTSLANYSFYLGAAKDNLEEIKRMDPQRVAGLKIFMGSSTGQLVVDDDAALERIFQYCPTLIATHCETDALIQQQEAFYRQQYGDAIPIRLHADIRNADQCKRCTEKAIDLARRFGSRLHVLHVTTADECPLFEAHPRLEEKQITAEVCVHHLLFCADDYERLGPLIKCNPAIKDARHRQALWDALAENRLDVIATDHAPHTWQEKMATTAEGKPDYFRIPSGLPLVQHGLNIMLHFFHQGKLNLASIVEKMCHAPARLFQIYRRGFLREGFFADLILVDLHHEWLVSKDNLYYQCGWSPLEGMTFRGRVTHTFVNGRLVYQNGVFDESCNGMRLLFDRN